MSTNTKDILIKALNTFWQAALAFIVVSIQPIIDAISQGDWEQVKLAGYAVVVAAVAAGLSAVKTYTVSKINQK